MEDFSRRDLTFAGDRLDAIAGVLERHSRPTPSIRDRGLRHRGPPLVRGSRMGLPLHFFVEALSWRHYPTTAYSQICRIIGDTRGTILFPSWSWVGWTGRVETDLPSDVNVQAEATDAANVTLDFCHFSSRSLTRRPALIEVTRPVRCVLHTWTKFLVVDITPRQQSGLDNPFHGARGFENWTLTCCDATPESASMSSHPSMRKGVKYWAALLSSHDLISGESEPWLLLEGADELHTERIGFMRLQDVNSNHVRDAYFRIF